MFPKLPRQRNAPRAGATHTRPSRARIGLALLCLLACVSPCAAQAGHASASARPLAEGGHAQTLRAPAGQASRAAGQQPAPSPTPAVRPRTTGAKVETAPAQAGGDGAARQPGAQGSQQSQEVVDEDEVVRVNSNLVIIPASVVDSRGRAITDLRADDFELKVDGEVKPIGDLSRTETPVQIALLFDNSASLSAAREFEKQAAVRFLQSVVRPIDRAAIYSISTTPTLSQTMTNDVQRLVRTVQNFGRPDGATALFDSVTQAADYMRPLPGRKVLLVVSDGTDTVSDASFEDAVGRALLAECQVYVVQTHQVEDPNLHDTVSEQRMWKLTEQTGGAVFVPQSVEDLDTVFTQISLDISQQYLLSYYPQDERKDNFFRFINLRVRTRPNTRVRARKGFYPPTAPQSAQSNAGSQLAGGFTSAARPGNSANAFPPNDAASSQRRAGAGARLADAGRDDNAAGRMIGPDGPDDDRPKQAAKSDDTSPTFSLTTVAATARDDTATKAKDSAMPEETSTPKSAATSTPAAASTPAPSPATTTPAKNGAAAKSQPAAQPSPTGQKTEKEAGEVKSDAPVSGGVLNSKALSLPPPAYPPAARNAGIYGRVVVEVLIDERGKVTGARAVSGHPWLQQAAVSAARLARFTATLLDGRPVSVKGSIVYDFMRP